MFKIQQVLIKKKSRITFALWNTAEELLGLNRKSVNLHEKFNDVKIVTGNRCSGQNISSKSIPKLIFGCESLPILCKKERENVIII